MRRRWVRVPPGPKEDLMSAVTAGVLGAGVGVATFYLVRLLLGREPVGRLGPEDSSQPRLPAPDVDA